MAPRKPFLIALKATVLLAVVALAAIVFGPTAKEAIASYAESASEHVFARFDPAHPAIEAFGALHLPPGLRNCAGGSSPTVGKTGFVCWRGTSQPVRTTSQVVAELKRLGAVDVSARCVELRKFGELCRITAVIKGQHLGLSLGPDTTQRPATALASGVFVSGGVGPDSSSWVVPLPRHATPVPIPSAN